MASVVECETALESDTVTMGGGGVGGVLTSSSTHNWPDDLIDIVNEPMGQTLDRMKKYSTSLSQVDRGTALP